MEEDTIKKTCKLCGNVGMSDGLDGFYYCLQCGSQDDDVRDMGVNDEDLIDDGRGALYQSSRRRTLHSSVASQASQCPPQSQSYWSQLTQEDAANLTQNSMPVKREREEWDFDGVGPTDPEDFGSLGGSVELGYEDYYNEVRGRYVMGLQKMIQLQCEALVEKFNVTPLIYGVAGTIWLRFVASTEVFNDEWADEVIQDSEFQTSGEPKKPRKLFRAEPHNLYGQRAVMVWCRNLRKRIQLSCSLAVSFLACHVAGEPILPTDLVKWSNEGRLPFFAAYVEIEKEKEFSQSSWACPISSSFMFRPSKSIHAQTLESFAASIAQAIGLLLPSVNFHGIASRYIRQLSLSLEKILPHACRIYEWSKPPELWLSENELRLPTRVCVMSILIVAIRNLYNIHGFGAWERSLSGAQERDNSNKVSGSSSKTNGLRAKSVRNLSYAKNPDLDASELLSKLEARYNGNVEGHDSSKDLQMYLQFCRVTTFPEYKPSVDDHEEEKTTKRFLAFYQNMKDPEPPGDNCPQLSPDVKHSPQNSQGTQNANPAVDDASAESFQSKAIRKLKLDMEEHRFCYIPPRSNIKVLDYLHYVRKRNAGGLTYSAHADYYILLRACAQIAQVDVRIMHLGVLSFEMRLAWLEKMTDHCLQVASPNVSRDSWDNQEKLVDS
ncbi:TATA box-binding protein-associated factor RNA polymerase I subunit B [Tripterygium wilfordii]|uniref:TATA box-binding protein-associated factor RNA polymerase I subunit B n=1 Tax=Tripterygium wilfordii TaxID=458696 RepID=UPI0018F84963|nr:TATA box-binding protein-associated factor RNA polymerase I subunit B [Tripterygium wilfordii]